MSTPFCTVQRDTNGTYYIENESSFSRLADNISSRYMARIMAEALNAEAVAADEATEVTFAIPKP